MSNNNTERVIFEKSQIATRNRILKIALVLLNTLRYSSQKFVFISLTCILAQILHVLSTTEYWRKTSDFNIEAFSLWSTQRDDLRSLKHIKVVFRNISMMWFKGLPSSVHYLCDISLQRWVVFRWFQRMWNGSCGRPMLPKIDHVISLAAY